MALNRNGQKVFKEAKARMLLVQFNGISICLYSFLSYWVFSSFVFRVFHSFLHCFLFISFSSLQCFLLTLDFQHTASLFSLMESEHSLLALCASQGNTRVLFSHTGNSLCCESVEVGDDKGLCPSHPPIQG